MSCSHYSRDQIFMGFQWTAQLPAAGCSSFHLSEDGKLVHSQSWSIGCGELHMRSEKHDDQLNSVQLSNPSGGTEGRWASPSPVCLVVISLSDKSLVLSAIVVLLLFQSYLFFTISKPPNYLSPAPQLLPFFCVLNDMVFLLCLVQWWWANTSQRSRFSFLTPFMSPKDRQWNWNALP